MGIKTGKAGGIASLELQLDSRCRRVRGGWLEVSQTAVSEEAGPAGDGSALFPPALAGSNVRTGGLGANAEWIPSGQ